MNNISIVIPIYNEESNLSILFKEIENELNNRINYEIVAIDDGSNDTSLKFLNDYSIKQNLKIIENKNNKGQSFSIYQGVRQAKYNNIVTIDADLQNNPKDILSLCKIFFNGNYGLVGGLRKKRKDNFIKIISSRIANYIRMIILNDNCIDTGCSLKIFSKNIFLTFPYFDGLHRFLPALFKGYGYSTYFINVDHRPRKNGISKYGTFNRLFVGMKTLILVYKIINLKMKKNND